MLSKNSHTDPFTVALSKKLSNLEILTTILAIISILLLITLLLFSRVITFNPTGPLLPSEQNPYAFATLYKLNNSQLSFNEKMGKISIFPDTNSAMSPSAFIKGYVDGLKAGTSHGVLILENTNFLLFSDENDNQLFHFNPTGSLLHNCKRDSNLNSNNEGHMGDLGDIIASDVGQANIDKYVNGFNVNLIYGRALVILKTEDPCDSESFYLQKNEILAFGILGIYSEDKEEIELKRQLIEKKKKNMFKFQEKVADPLKKNSKNTISDEMKFKSDEKMAKHEDSISTQKIADIPLNSLIDSNNNNTLSNDAKSIPESQIVNDNINKHDKDNNDNLPFTNNFDNKENNNKDDQFDVDPFKALFGTDSHEANSVLFQKKSHNNKNPMKYNNTWANLKRKPINNLYENFTKNTSEASSHLFESSPALIDTTSQPVASEVENFNSLFDIKDGRDSIFKNLINYDKPSQTNKMIEKSLKFLPRLNEKDEFKDKRNNTNKLPNYQQFEEKLMTNRKSLFENAEKKKNVSNTGKLAVKNNRNLDIAAENSIFDKLTNLFNKTDTIPKEIHELKENPDVFIGIDLAKPSSVQTSKPAGKKVHNTELKQFQKSFEEGVQQNLHNKLRKLEDKL